MPRIAAIDCGTNSIRLLIADIDTAAGSLTDVVRRMEVVRLGQGVDRTGEFAPESLERTLAVTAEYAAQCQEHGVEAIRFAATSASRDARNRQEFIDGVRERLGVEPEVITGPEEAALSFKGAISALDSSLPGPYLVVDLGGGSTELVIGDDAPTAAHSMDVGCVRITERHLADDPPSVEQIKGAQADIRAELDVANLEVPLGQTRTLVGLAGSITTVTAHVLNLPEYSRDAINGAQLSIADATRSSESLLMADRATRAEMPFMHPGRVDVIGAGALVWSEVMARVVAEVEAGGGTLDTTVTSEHDILDGIAFSAAERL